MSREIDAGSSTLRFLDPKAEPELSMVGASFSLGWVEGLRLNPPPPHEPQNNHKLSRIKRHLYMCLWFVDSLEGPHEINQQVVV